MKTSAETQSQKKNIVQKLQENLKKKVKKKQFYKTIKFFQLYNYLSVTTLNMFTTL